MASRSDIREGYEVYDASNIVIGRVKRVINDVLDVGDYRIPSSAISWGDRAKPGEAGGRVVR